MYFYDQLIFSFPLFPPLRNNLSENILILENRVSAAESGVRHFQWERGLVFGGLTLGGVCILTAFVLVSVCQDFKIYYHINKISIS